jgi:hypothetical protein
MWCLVGRSLDFAFVKAISFPGISAKTCQMLSKSQAQWPEHESPALLLETFPDTFDASLLSRHIQTHPRTPSSGGNASFSSHEIAWQFFRSIRITICDPYHLIPRSHAGAEVLALQAMPDFSSAGKGHGVTRKYATEAVTVISVSSGAFSPRHRAHRYWLAANTGMLNKKSQTATHRPLTWGCAEM